MNLIDLKVTKILSDPFQLTVVMNSKWFIKVKAEAWGRDSTHTLMFDTKEKAEDIKPGYIFQG